MIDLCGSDGFDLVTLDPASTRELLLTFFKPMKTRSAILCFKGGSDSVDEEYNARMATIAEAQQGMAQTYYDFWESDYKPMEEAQIAANMSLIPTETALSQAKSEAELSMLPSSTNLSVAANESALSLIPGQTELASAQNKDSLLAMNERAPVRSAFYDAALNGVDVESRANQAGADAEQAFSGATASASRDAARMGVNPGSGSFGDAMNSNAISKAKLIGGARTSARTGAEAENFQRLTSAMGS